MSDRPPRVELLAWAALALLTSVVVSWPLALNLDTHTVVGLYNPDLITSIWWYDRVASSVATASSPFHADDLLWPQGTHVGASIWNLGAPLLAVPIRWLFGPVGALNGAAIAFTALTGALAGAGVRRLGGDRVAAAVATVAGASLAFGLVECTSGRGEQALLAPILLALVGWSRLRESAGDWKLALATGAAVGATGAVYWMGGYLLAIVLAADVLYRVVRRRMDRARARDVGVVVGVAALVALPFLIPVLVGSSQGSDHSALTAAQAGGLDGAMGLPWALTGPFAPMGIDGSRRWPLLALPVLALAAWKGPNRWLAVVGLVSALLALGRHVWAPFLVGGQALAIPLPHRALDVLPGMSRFWWPYRWTMLLLPCFAVSLGGLLTLLKPSWKRTALGIGLALWSVYEGAATFRLSPALRPMPLTQVEVPPVFEQLGQEPGEHPLLLLPPRSVNAGLLHWQVWHRQPIDVSIGWQLAGAIPDSWAPTLAQAPLIDALIFQEHPQQRAWTEADAGGFHYVVLFSGQPEPMDGLGYDGWQRRVTAVLGRPQVQTHTLVVWGLPGAPPLGVH